MGPVMTAHSIANSESFVISESITGAFYVRYTTPYETFLGRNHYISLQEATEAAMDWLVSRAEAATEEPTQCPPK